MEFFRLVSSDGFLLIIAVLAEMFLFREKDVSKTIQYDKLNFIHPDHRTELLEDLDQRFGISEIRELKFGRIDTLKNSVRLKVIFKDKNNSHLSD